jgi:CDP-diacylglycerol--glycerol-3-phosphate 3-phosphatidyltransferase
MQLRSRAAAVQPALGVPRPRGVSPTCALATTWRDDLPNGLTIARVMAVPVLIGAFYGAQHWRPLRRVPAAIFAACAITDWLDGYLARRWGANSDFGAFLDPVADKLLVCACLSVLSGALGAVVALPAAIMVCREVGISALREFMGSRGQRSSVAVGLWGKLKTATQMVALQLLLLAVPTTSRMEAMALEAGLVLLYVAAVLSCASAVLYCKAAWPLLRPPGGRED